MLCSYPCTNCRILSRTTQIRPSNLKPKFIGNHFIMSKTFLHWHTDNVPRKIEKLVKWVSQRISLNGVRPWGINLLSKCGKPMLSQYCAMEDSHFFHSNLPHIVRLLFGTLDLASHWTSQVSASPISSLVMFREQGEQVSLALPKYPALHTAKRETNKKAFQ